MRKITINSRTLFAVTAVIAVTTLASAFMAPSAAFAAKSSPIRIGAAGPYSGDLSKIGLDALDAIKLAVEEVNKDGGIDGRKLELVTGDDSADPSKALLVADKFGTDNSLVGVIGPMNSSCVAASLPAYQQAGLPIITPSASGAALADRGMNVFHRLCSRDDAQGQALAKFIANELKVKEIYVIDDKTTYGQSLADNTVKALDKLNVRIKRGQVASDDKDLSPILTRIKSEKPDAVFLGLSSPAQASSLIKQAAGLGLKATFVSGNVQKDKDLYIKGASGLAEGSFVTSVGKDVHDVPGAKEFITRFEKRNGPISAFTAQAYEAANVLIDAVKRASSKSKNGDVNRSSVQKALDDTDGYKGILGFPISFNTKGDMVGYRIFILKVENGDFNEVANYAAATK